MINRHNRYDRQKSLRLRADCVDQLIVDRVDWSQCKVFDQKVSLRSRVDCVDRLTVDRVYWSWSVRSMDVIQRKSWLCRSTDCRSCRLITTDTIDWYFSKQWLIVSINLLSSVEIHKDRYDRQVFFRKRLDCVIQMTADHVDCLTIDTIDMWSLEQKLIVSINWLVFVSTDHDASGVLQTDSRLCRSTNCWSYRLMTINTINGCSSEQWLIALINRLSIDNDRPVLCSARVDCVNQLIVDNNNNNIFISRG